MIDPANVPFTDWSIKIGEWHWLHRWAIKHAIKSVVEFGPGASTYAFIGAGCVVHSIEDNEEWHARWKREIEQAYIYTRTEARSRLPGRRFSMAFVDGPEGARDRYSRIDSCLFAAELTSTMILHDSKRNGERRTIGVLEELGWKVTETFDNDLGLTVLKKD